MKRMTRSKARPELPTNATASSREQVISFNSPKALKETAKHLRTIKRKSSQLRVTATPALPVITTSGPANAVEPNQVADDPPRVRAVSKRRFIDPQPNAQRVSSDTDISQDGGFEKDRRVTDVPVRRKKKPARKRRLAEPVVDSHRAPKKARPVEEEHPNVTAQQNLERSPKPSQLVNYKMASEQAKMIVALQPRKVQTRRGWTDEETETLIELIEDWGTSWSDLKEKDRKKILKDRDQVALKDKARNIKFDFLKAGPELPKHFEDVALNKMQLEKLRSLGIIYNTETGMRGDDDTEDQ